MDMLAGLAVRKMDASGAGIGCTTTRAKTGRDIQAEGLQPVLPIAYINIWDATKAVVPLVQGTFHLAATTRYRSW